MKPSIFLTWATGVVASVLILAPITAAYDIPKGNKPNIDQGALAPLQALSRGLSAIADHAKKGVVFVSVSKTVQGMPLGQINPFDFFFGPNGQGGRGGRPQEYKQQGLGSGFFIDLKKGYILTNNHVIEGADEIQAKLANGQTYSAKVVGRDKNTDVAVVQIINQKFNRKGLVELGLTNSDQVRVGDLCVALGAPFGLEASLSLGVVSALGRANLKITELGNFIQTDAAINPGNSGGPLLSASGEVMGINTAIFSKSGGYNGIGFAIPANLARQVANSLINDGKVERGYLGVMLSDLDSELAGELKLPKGTKGALIRSVQPGTAAARAKLEPGDVIVQLDNRKVSSSADVRTYIGLLKPGTRVNLRVYRDGKEKNLTVKLSNYNQDTTTANQPSGKEDSYGMQVVKLTPARRSRYGLKNRSGAVISFVAPNSPADRAGIAEGDMIVKVNNKIIRSPADFAKAAKSKERLLIRIERQGQMLFIPLRR